MIPDQFSATRKLWQKSRAGLDKRRNRPCGYWEVLCIGIPPQFAYPAAFGDLLAALLALIAILALVRNAASARLLVWVFNVEGTLDLFNAIALATIYRAQPYMGPAYWIPAFWVPALLVTHYITFVFLWKHWKRN